MSNIKTQLFKKMLSSQSSDCLWLFGYGSLLWRREFVESEALKGYVKGCDRRFYCKSVVQRGTEERPGRVATLVRNPKGRVEGIAYKVIGKEYIESVFSTLTAREQSKRAYLEESVEFHSYCGRQINIMAYVANEESPFTDCNSNIEDISKHIVSAKGVGGYNVEYIIRLGHYMRENNLLHRDEHLNEIYQLICRYFNLNSKDELNWEELFANTQFRNKLDNFVNNKI